MVLRVARLHDENSCVLSGLSRFGFGRMTTLPALGYRKQYKALGSLMPFASMLWSICGSRLLSSAVLVLAVASLVLVEPPTATPNPLSASTVYRIAGAIAEKPQLAQARDDVPELPPVDVDTSWTGSDEYYEARRYLLGEESERDPEKARELMRAAALRNDVLAQFEYAWMLEHGVGGDPSPEDAAEWYERAANSGLSIAMYNLGIMYERGRGVPASAAEALHLYQRAVEAGGELARFNLAMLLIKELGLEAAADEAIEHLRAASVFGIAEADYNLALLLYHTAGDEQTMTEAFELFRGAANKTEDLRAYSMLGLMSMRGEGTDADFTQAASYFSVAARAGDATSQTLLATLYADGRGVTRSRTRAYMWLLIALESGEPRAGRFLTELQGVMTSEEIAEAHERVSACVVSKLTDC